MNPTSPLEIDDDGIRRLAEFFLLLKRWDNEAKENYLVNRATRSHREAVQDGTKC